MGLKDADVALPSPACARPSRRAEAIRRGVMATGDSTTMPRGVVDVAVDENSDGRVRLRALDDGAAGLTLGEAATPRAAADMRRRAGVGPLADRRGPADDDVAGSAAIVADETNGCDCDAGETSAGDRCRSTSILTLSESACTAGRPDALELVDSRLEPLDVLERFEVCECQWRSSRAAPTHTCRRSPRRPPPCA